MLKEAPQNKMQTENTAKDFFFPEHNVTVQANSIEEAEKKLQEIIKNKK